MRFEAGKTIKELGIDTTKKFRIVNDYIENYEELEIGDIFTLSSDDDSRCPYFRKVGEPKGEEYVLWLSELEYADRSKSDKYEVGDILVDSDGDCRRVLGYCGGEGDYATYALSEYNLNKDSDRMKECCSTRTRYQLNNMNLSLDIQEEPITELTLEEVAKLAGKDVKNIRIKE